MKRFSSTCIYQSLLTLNASADATSGSRLKQEDIDRHLEYACQFNITPRVNGFESCPENGKHGNDAAHLLER